MSLLDPVYEQAICAQNPWLWDTEDHTEAKVAARLCRTDCPVYRLCLEDTTAAEMNLAGKLHGVRAGMVVKDRMLLRKRARA